MNLQTFVRQNRAELDRLINSALYRYDGRGGPGRVPDPPPRRNDQERLAWIRNDEALYNWARAEGCRP